MKNSLAVVLHITANYIVIKQQLDSEMNLTVTWSSETRVFLTEKLGYLQYLMLGTNWVIQYECQPGNLHHHINKDTHNRFKRNDDDL